MKKNLAVLILILSAMLCLLAACYDTSDPALEIKPDTGQLTREEHYLMGYSFRPPMLSERINNSTLRSYKSRDGHIRFWSRAATGEESAFTMPTTASTAPPTTNSKGETGFVYVPPVPDFLKDELLLACANDFKTLYPSYNNLFRIDTMGIKFRMPKPGTEVEEAEDIRNPDNPEDMALPGGTGDNNMAFETVIINNLKFVKASGWFWDSTSQRTFYFYGYFTITGEYATREEIAALSAVSPDSVSGDAVSGDKVSNDVVSAAVTLEQVPQPLVPETDTSVPRYAVYFMCFTDKPAEYAAEADRLIREVMNTISYQPN